MMCLCRRIGLFFFKQKTAYEMRISDWSSDVCSSDLAAYQQPRIAQVALSKDRKKGSGGEFLQRHAGIRQPGLVGTRLCDHQRAALDIVLHRIDAIERDHLAAAKIDDREGAVFRPAPYDGFVISD